MGLVVQAGAAAAGRGGQVLSQHNAQLALAPGRAHQRACKREVAIGIWSSTMWQAHLVPGVLQAAAARAFGNKSLKPWPPTCKA